jgi:hypothetical protein
MRTNRALLLAVIAAGACAKPSPSVFVDLDAVMKSEAVLTPTFVLPKPPTAIQLKPVTMRGLPAEVILGPKAEAASAARRSMDLNRQKAYRQLEAHLRDVYLADVKHEEELQIADLAPARSAEESKARQALLAELDAYGRVRGPLSARLALLVGFPDTDPYSKRGAASEENVPQKRAEEARALRSQVKQLDSAFDGKARGIYALVAHQSDVELTKIRAGIEKSRVEALSRAEREASAQVKKIQANFGTTLIERGDTVLPATPDRSFIPKQQASLPPAPSVDLTPSVSNRKAALRDELEIWLGINGYREARGPQGAPDYTAKFIQWRKSHHPGP